jgi:hypothetical protein
LDNTPRPLRLRLGIFVALALALLALYPQFNLQLKRGHEWNGGYAFFSQDEVAYSAYVNALIDGRPRRNDPYTGRDDAIDAPQPESLFSIQFAPAYAIAIPARTLGLSASTMFIVLTPLIAFASALALFWLIGMVTRDERLAAAGSLAVLCLGTFALLYTPLRALVGLDTTYTFEYFPFLRRYVPALPFPFFFLFCALVWRALKAESKRGLWMMVASAGAVFALLVFSYFYLWTAAAAWLGCLAALWLIARRGDGHSAFKIFAALGVLALAALLPYYALLSNRAQTMDTVQLLAHSHAPDFTRSSIKLGLIVCALLAYATRRGRIKWRDPRALLAASFALTPFVVFNQQIITGLSLQPLHYELFITRYLALLALVLTLALLWQRRERTFEKMPRRAFACLIVVALGWGMFETVLETKQHEWGGLARDESLPVARRLRELARDGSQTTASDNQSTVLYFDLGNADLSPILAPQPVLWSPHTPAFSGVTAEENRERIYQYLYYTGEDLTGVDEQEFDKLEYRKKFLIQSLIDWGLNSPVWTVNWKQITPQDVRAVLNDYAHYAASFSRAQATHPTLSYVVTEGETDLHNLDRWYERDAGEHVGRFTLFHVRIRP